MFCQNCGKQINDTSAFCPHCGQQATPSPVTPPPAVNQTKTAAFVAQRNAEKGIMSPPAEVSCGNKTQSFIAAKQASPAAPVPPVQPVQAPAPQQFTQAAAPQQPVQQFNPGYPPQYQPPVQKKKKFPVWAIILIIFAALLIAGTVSVVVIGTTIKKQIEADASELQSDFEDLFDTTPSDETDTQEGATTADFSNVGRPEERDFDWYQGVPQGIPSGAKQLSEGKDVNGEWKAYYVIEGGVKELSNIELQAGDRAVTVICNPYMVNYDGYEWQYESYAEKYSYEGAIDGGTITAFDEKIGTIYLFGFYEKDGAQYGFGSTMLQSGEKVDIALVRP